MSQSKELAEVESLERRLLDPQTRGSKPQLDALIADNFQEFGRSGRMWQKPEIIDSLSQAPDLNVAIDGIQSRQIGNDVVLITYTSRHIDEESETLTFRSSIWQRHDEPWKIVFHQATPAN